MKIGFDAKRAYHNNTGLGFFSRVLISLLSTHFPENDYYLYNPKPGKAFGLKAPNLHEVLPRRTLHRTLSAAWRSKWVVKDLLQEGIDIYHGPSHEIPVGLPKTGIPSVVTIHDLFPEIYPQQYRRLDVQIYRAKSRYACREATKIMAISQESKNQIMDLYQIPAEKISVIYQSCAPRFTQLVGEKEKERVRQNYQLPPQFFLHVGTIIERKNLLNICKAIQLLQQEAPIPLVVIGKGSAFKEKVKTYLREQNLEHRVLFLSDQLAAAGKKPFVETEDLPAIYQLSTAMIYPSYFEGFGMPLIEAMSGGVPVITSNTSCLPEIGGDAAWYVNPDEPTEMAAGLLKIFKNASFAQSLGEKGLENAKRFAPELYVQEVMKMYQTVLK